MHEGQESSSLRRLISHGGVYTASRVASHAAAFVLVPLYTHALGSEGLGVIEVSNAARNVLSIVMLQGLHSAVLRLRYELDPAEHKRLETTLTWYLALSSLALCALAAVLGAPLWNLVVQGVPFYPFGLLTFGSAACAAMGGLLDRKLQGDQRPGTLAVVTLARTVGTLGAIIVFVAPLGRGPAGKLEGELLAGLAGAIAAWVIIAPGPLREVTAAHVKRGTAWGWPLIPHGIAGLINDAIDRVMINALLGLSAAGIYALGYRVASVSLVLMMAINQALMPLFVETMRMRELEQDSARAKQLDIELGKLGIMVLTLGALCVQGVTAIGPLLIKLLGTEEFASSWLVLAPVGAGALAWTCYATWSQSVTYRREGMRLLPWITICTAAVNVGLNWLLIPKLGMQAAAWTTFASNSTQAVLVLVIGQRITPVPYRWARWIALLGLSALGLVLLTVLEVSVASVVVRYACKLGWLLLFAVLATRIAGVTVRDLRARRGRGSSAPPPEVPDLP
jgi:O-antigen/teichoic acid export membrane protein